MLDRPNGPWTLPIPQLVIEEAPLRAVAEGGWVVLSAGPPQGAVMVFDTDQAPIWKPVL